MTEVDRHIAIAWLSLGHRGAVPAPARIRVLKPVNSRASAGHRLSSEIAYMKSCGAPNNLLNPRHSPELKELPGGRHRECNAW
jgi:hypothetical protein